MLDPQDRVLLFRDHDPMVDDFTWWNTPGGGIDPGESPVQAVVREVHEETGLVADADTVLGPLAHRCVVHGYSDCVVHQTDDFFALRVPVFDVEPAGLTAAEAAMLLEHRWWSLDDLEASTERIWPAEIVELCELADRPDAWPVRLPDVEESSVLAQLGYVAPDSLAP